MSKRSKRSAKQAKPSALESFSEHLWIQHDFEDDCQERNGLDFSTIYDKTITIPEVHLAMHKKKLEEIKGWLEAHCKSNCSRGILVLSGPTGSGKTTVIHQLCRQLQIKLIEDEDYYEKHAQTSCLPPKKYSYPSLDLIQEAAISTKNNKQTNPSRSELILMDDYLPFGHCAKSIELLLAIPPSHLTSTVIIITDPIENQSILRSDGNIIKLLSLSHTLHIQTNPIALTLVKKALSNANIPAGIESGDLRATIISTLWNNISPSNRALVAAPDVFLDLFHALGKVLYPRKDSHQNRSIDLNELWIEDRDLFLPYLQENYLHPSLSLHTVMVTSDSISLVDSILADSIQSATLPDRYLSMAISNHSTQAHRGFLSFKKPRIFALPKLESNKHLY